MKLNGIHVAIAGIVSTAAVVIAGFGLYGYVKSVETHERELKDTNQAMVKTVEDTNRANIERTEERSQFWQKLVPWGKDEAEENKTSE